MIKNSKRIQIQILNFFCCPLSLVLSLFGHNFCFLAPVENKLYSHEAFKFFYLQKKIEKS